MAKKKNASDARGMNSQGKTVTYKGKKVDFSQPSKQKPTEAVTAPGQKATGLAKSTKKDRFKLTGQTPVKKGDTAFGGSGGPLGSQGFLKTTPGRVASAALVVTASPASGQVTRGVAKKLGARAFQKTGGAAYKAGMQNIAGATGAGGRVSQTFTPFGPTLRSTVIGTAKQQSARMGNLAKGIENTAIRAGNIRRGEVVSGVMKAGQVAGRAGRATAGLAVAGSVAKKVRGGKGTSKKK